MTEDFSEIKVSAGVKWDHIKIDIKIVKGPIYSLNLYGTGISKANDKTVVDALCGKDLMNVSAGESESLLINKQTER